MLTGPIVTDADRAWAMAKCPKWMRLHADAAWPEIVDDDGPLDGQRQRTIQPPCWADFVAEQAERFERYFAGKRKSYPEWSRLWRHTWWPKADAKRRFPQGAPAAPAPFFRVGTPEFARAMQVASVAERRVWARFGAQFLPDDPRLEFVRGKAEVAA